MSSSKNTILLATRTNLDGLEYYFRTYNLFIDNHTSWLMRQKMKRLRSIFRLLETHVRTGKKLKKSFDIIFDILGKYRDANQMLVFTENHLKHEADNDFIFQLLQNEITETGANLHELLKSPLPIDFISCLEKYISKVNKLSGECLKKIEQPYIKQRYKKIRLYIKTEKFLENKTLHRCRILLKQIINIMKISGHKFKSGRLLLKFKDLEQIDKDLGTWHDLDVILTHIKSLELHINENVQKEQFSALILSLESEEKQYYEKAVNALSLLKE